MQPLQAGDHILGIVHIHALQAGGVILLAALRVLAGGGLKIQIDHFGNQADGVEIFRRVLAHQLHQHIVKEGGAVAILVFQGRAQGAQLLPGIEQLVFIRGLIQRHRLGRIAPGGGQRLHVGFLGAGEMGEFAAQGKARPALRRAQLGNEGPQLPFQGRAAFRIHAHHHHIRAALGIGEAVHIVLPGQIFQGAARQRLPVLPRRFHQQNHAVGLAEGDIQAAQVILRLLLAAVFAPDQANEGVAPHGVLAHLIQLLAAGLQLVHGVLQAHHAGAAPRGDIVRQGDKLLDGLGVAAGENHDGPKAKGAHRRGKGHKAGEHRARHGPDIADFRNVEIGQARGGAEPGVLIAPVGPLARLVKGHGGGLPLEGIEQRVPRQDV